MPRSLRSLLLSAIFLFVVAVPRLESHAFPAPQSGAPSASSTSGEFTLTGIVVNSVTNEPVRGALVQVLAPVHKLILTGADGRFRVVGLPTGLTSLTARKPGYFADGESDGYMRSPGSYQVGPNAPPVVLKLVPEGLVYGRITDENGEPVEFLPLHLQQPQIVQGRRIWLNWRQANTDENGEFRFAELPQGTYYLSAGPSTIPVVFSAVSSQPGAQGYPVVFYPAAADLSGAAPIKITPGKRQEINLSVSLQPFFRISGTLSGNPPDQPAGIVLLTSSGGFLPGALRMGARNGVFQSPGIPAGNYILQAQSRDGKGEHVLTAEIPVTVQTDLTGIHLSLSPAVSIPVHVQVISSHNGEQQQEGGSQATQAQVILHSRDAAAGRADFVMQWVEGQPSGHSGQISNVSPGSYAVEISPFGTYYAESARSGSLNLLRDDLPVAPGAAVQPIEIVLRDDVAKVKGIVSSAGQPAAGGIFAISQEYPRRAVIQATASDGMFEVPNLAPGTHWILAVDRWQAFEYANLEVLRKYLPLAQEVRVSSNQTVTVNLELIQLEE
jgi:hypothetical protein